MNYIRELVSEMQLRGLKALFNPTQEQIEERDPIIAYSFYLSGRVYALVAIADEILDNMDQGFAENVVYGDKISRAETLMWLWILGAYEVVRTMCQTKGCFSANVADELRALKHMLSVVRMPAAKMEKAGKTVPVTSYRSPTGWDCKNKDFLVNDPETNPDISARAILLEFDRVFSSITRQDVLMRHEDWCKPRRECS